MQDKYGGGTQPHPSRGLSLALFSMRIPTASGQASIPQRTQIHPVSTELQNSCMAWAGKPEKKSGRVISLEMAGKEFCWRSGNGKRHFDAGSARSLLGSTRNSASSISGSMREWNFIAGCIQTRELPWIFQFPMGILALWNCESSCRVASSSRTCTLCHKKILRQPASTTIVSAPQCRKLPTNLRFIDITIARADQYTRLVCNAICPVNCLWFHSLGF